MLNYNEIICDKMIEKVIAQFGGTKSTTNHGSLTSSTTYGGNKKTPHWVQEVFVNVTGVNGVDMTFEYTNNYDVDKKFYNEYRKIGGCNNYFSDNCYGDAGLLEDDGLINPKAIEVRHWMTANEIW